MSTATVFAQAGRMADQVRAESRELDPAQVAFTLLMLPFVAIGFLGTKVLRVAWAIIAFAWVAIVTGHRRAGGFDRSAPGGG